MKNRLIALVIGVALLAGTGVFVVQRAYANGSEKKPVDFEYKDLSGKKIKLSNYRGKIVVVDVWATWCGYCVSEIPGLIDLQAEATKAKKPIQIIGISVDQNTGALTNFVQKNKINYPIINVKSKTVKPFGDVYGLPTKFIINKDGVIVDKIIGAIEKDDLEKRIEKYR
ncbi:MAG TPA: TlpA disulfide reductase family protein [Armatimonadota bacterium]|nr:TlpA disulfide reductase family protein [Armatimonadota bacterium]